MFEILTLIKTNLEKGMSKSTQKLQADTIDELLSEVLGEYEPPLEV